LRKTSSVLEFLIYAEGAIYKKWDVAEATSHFILVKKGLPWELSKITLSELNFVNKK